jgi:hypothetical protein
MNLFMIRAETGEISQINESVFSVSSILSVLFPASVPDSMRFIWLFEPFVAGIYTLNKESSFVEIEKFENFARIGLTSEFLIGVSVVRTAISLDELKESIRFYHRDKLEILKKMGFFQ